MELTVWDVLIVINTKMKKIKDPLQILQIWFSSSFPVGSYAYSHGLEALIDDDKIKNTVLKKSDELNNKAKISAELIEKGHETLFHLTRNNSNDDSEKKYTKFCRRVLGRVLHYAASLIPEITSSPQDIDDAMKLGFNWIRGPFEIIDALGIDTISELFDEN